MQAHIQARRKDTGSYSFIPTIIHTHIQVCTRTQINWLKIDTNVPLLYSSSVSRSLFYPDTEQDRIIPTDKGNCFNNSLNTHYNPIRQGLFRKA